MGHDFRGTMGHGRVDDYNGTGLEWIGLEMCSGTGRDGYSRTLFVGYNGAGSGGWNGIGLEMNNV